MLTIDPHVDCRHWNLTPSQCARHHMRLAEYYIRRSQHHARLGSLSLKVALASLIAVAALLLLPLTWR